MYNQPMNGAENKTTAIFSWTYGTPTDRHGVEEASNGRLRGFHVENGKTVYARWFTPNLAAPSLQARASD
jgi:hypothetical protein